MLDTLQAAFISHEFYEERGMDRIEKVVVIVVDSHSEGGGSPNWEKKESPPGLIKQLLQSSGVPIERYSFETIELMKDRAAIAGWRRQLAVAQLRLEGMSEAEAEARVPRIEVHVMSVSFDRIADPVRRGEVQDLPTSFVLPGEDVDNLREVAGEIMRSAPEYRELLRSYGEGAGG